MHISIFFRMCIPSSLHICPPPHIDVLVNYKLVNPLTIHETVAVSHACGYTQAIYQSQIHTCSQNLMQDATSRYAVAHPSLASRNDNLFLVLYVLGFYTWCIPTVLQLKSVLVLLGQVFQCHMSVQWMAWYGLHIKHDGFWNAAKD